MSDESKNPPELKSPVDRPDAYERRMMVPKERRRITERCKERQRGGDGGMISRGGMGRELTNLYIKEPSDLTHFNQTAQRARKQSIQSIFLILPFLWCMSRVTAGGPLASLGTFLHI